MDRIILEVGDRSAKKWMHASPAKKEQLSKSIEKLIDQSLSANDDDFWKFVDRISLKAESNGLTEDQLRLLLDEE